MAQKIIIIKESKTAVSRQARDSWRLNYFWTGRKFEKYIRNFVNAFGHNSVHVNFL